MEKELYKEIVKQIRKSRIEQGISQIKLASNSGLSIATIKRLEAGSETLKVIDLLGICSYLKISPSKILDGVLRSKK